MGKPNISRTYENTKRASDVVNCLLAKNITKRKRQKVKLKDVKKALKHIKIKNLPIIDNNHYLLCDSFKTDSPTVDLFDEVKQSKDYNPVMVKPIVHNFSSESGSSEDNETDHLSPITIINPTPVKRERRPRKIRKKKIVETVTVHSSNCINNPINLLSGHTYLDESVNSPLWIEKEPVFKVPEVGKDTLHLRTEDFTSSNILDSLLKASEDTSNINVRVLPDAPQYITSTPFEPSKTRKIDCSVLSTILPKNNESTSTSVDLSSIDCLVEKSLEEIKKWDNSVPDFSHDIPKITQTPKWGFSVIKRRNIKKAQNSEDIIEDSYKRTSNNELQINTKSYFTKKCNIKLEYCTELEKRLDWKLNCSPIIRIDRMIDILGINNSISCRKLNSPLFSTIQNKLSAESISFKTAKKLRKKKVLKRKNVLKKKTRYKNSFEIQNNDKKQPIISLNRNKVLETLLVDSKLSSKCVVKLIKLNINENKEKNDNSGVRAIKNNVNKDVNTFQISPKKFITVRRKKVSIPEDSIEKTSSSPTKKSTCEEDNSKTTESRENKHLSPTELNKLLKSPIIGNSQTNVDRNHPNCCSSCSDLFDSKYFSPCNHENLVENEINEIHNESFKRSYSKKKLNKSKSVSSTEFIRVVSKTTKKSADSSTQTEDPIDRISRNSSQKSITFLNNGIKEMYNDCQSIKKSLEEKKLLHSSFQEQPKDVQGVKKNKEKRFSNEIINLSDYTLSALKDDSFVMPTVPLAVPKERFIMKPGKSYKRSMIILKRKSSVQVLNASFISEISAPSSCSLLSNNRLTGSEFSRKSSRASVFCGFTGFPVNTEFLSQSFADCCTGFKPDNTDNRPLEGKFGRLSVNESFEDDHKQNDDDTILSNETLPLQIVPFASPNEKAKALIFEKCRQTEPLPFAECYPNSLLKNCFKIGEGVFGEVFQFRGENHKPTVMKIIPIEGNQMVNGEVQKKFEEIVTEIVIAMELSSLRENNSNRTSSFSELQRVRCVKGCYPERLLYLWDLYDDDRNSDNDSPDMFGDDQLYIVLELANGGQDLEAFVFNNALQAFSIFQQVSCALAVAEEALEFEHRDLHWGNVLVSKVDRDEKISYVLNGRTVTLPSYGVAASIIDFTLSRITKNNCCIFTDVSNDLELFVADGDYQFEVYRLMKKRNGNEWGHFDPYTNILWLDYLVDKAITALRYQYVKTKIHRQYIQKLKDIKKVILNFTCVKDFVINNVTF